MRGNNRHKQKETRRVNDQRGVIAYMQGVEESRSGGRDGRWREAGDGRHMIKRNVREQNKFGNRRRRVWGWDG